MLDDKGTKCRGLPNDKGVNMWAFVVKTVYLLEYVMYGGLYSAGAIAAQDQPGALYLTFSPFCEYDVRKHVPRNIFRRLSVTFRHISVAGGPNTGTLNCRFKEKSIRTFFRFNHLQG